MAEVIRLFAAENPNPRCELYYKTPFQLLVSVILSAQATDKSVNLAMMPLYDKGLDAKAIKSMGEKGFLEKIRTIGLAPTKARNVLRMIDLLEKKFNGVIPDSREELTELPGVGRKTANVVLGEIFHQPTLAVDTHVFRVTARLGFHSETKPEACEEKLLTLIEPKSLPAAHHWFILLGRYTCTAKKPHCERCPVESLCPQLIQ